MAGDIILVLKFRILNALFLSPSFEHGVHGDFFLLLTVFKFHGAISFTRTRGALRSEKFKKDH